jgi:hypothetical protein
VDALSVGDVVKVGPGACSPSFMFSRKTPGAAGQFEILTTGSGASLLLTGGHDWYANGALVPASAVIVGDALRRGSGEQDKVAAIGSTSGDGLCKPQTIHGDTAVSGIVASTSTTAIEPRLAHVLLLPVRAAHHWLGLSTGALGSGADSLAGVLPAGVVLHRLFG